MPQQPTQFVIIGAGGFARELAWLWQECRKHDPDFPELIGFIDDTPEWKAWEGIPVLGGDEWAAQHLRNDTGFAIGIGHSKLRQRLSHKYESLGFHPVSLIHPQTQMGPGNSIGPGSIICAGVTVTVQASLGKHVLVNLHSTIGHDSQIGDFTVISPGVHLSGKTSVGPTCDLGSGAVLLPGMSIPAGTVIGAGAVVTRDIEQPGTYIGVPAKKWL